MTRGLTDIPHSWALLLDSIRFAMNRNQVRCFGTKAVLWSSIVLYHHANWPLAIMKQRCLNTWILWISSILTMCQGQHWLKCTLQFEFDIIYLKQTAFLCNDGKIYKDLLISVQKLSLDSRKGYISLLIVSILQGSLATDLLYFSCTKESGWYTENWNYSCCVRVDTT